MTDGKTDDKAGGREPPPKPAARPAKGLGRGLAALLRDEPEMAPARAEPAAPAPGQAGSPRPAPSAAMPAAEIEALRREAVTLPIEFLRPGRFQPRHHFEDEALAQLAQSLREKGMLQPILVRPLPQKDSYEILAGERRWRAAQQAKLHDVPVVVRSFSDRDALEIALVENLQRQDLSPIEEAQGYERLRIEFGATQEQLASALGKSRSHIANMLRLLELPPRVRSLLDEGKLSAGHARALATAPDIEALALKVVRDGLSVRQTERLAQHAAGAGRGTLHRVRGARAPAAAGTALSKEGWNARNLPASYNEGTRSSADVRALQKRLEEVLGLRVEIESVAGAERTRLTLYCNDFDQLDDVIHRLEKPPGRG